MSVPKFPNFVLQELVKNGYEAYFVGGAVRDYLLKKPADDWDIATNAFPEEILKTFEHSHYFNRFGTVIVVDPETNEGIHCTTFRSDGEYTNSRHPNEVKFGVKLEDDLSRRDFTINALALSKDGNIVDRFGGIDDLNAKIKRAVGDPNERFAEDALRMMRAVRFAVTLDFDIDQRTKMGIIRSSSQIAGISGERVRDELLKVFKLPDAKKAERAIRLLDELGLIIYILPELKFCQGVLQNHHHTLDVYEHSLSALYNCPSKKYTVKLAALFHDIGKPQTKEIGKNGEATFYNHQFVSEKLTKSILERLHFSREDVSIICHLVRNHMFFYDQEITDSAVRRILRVLGPDNLEDFIDLRVGDRLGSGTKEAKSWRLRQFEERAQVVRHHAISVNDLKINGSQIMSILAIPPGKIIGEVQRHLLDLVLEDPERNDESFLRAETARYKTNPTKIKADRNELDEIRKKILIRDF